MRSSQTRENDGRKLDRKTLEGIRMRVVQQVAEGSRPDDLAASLGFSRAAVFSWVAKYREGGTEALRTRKAPGRVPRLTSEQLEYLQHLVVYTDPRDHGLSSALWTRDLVRQLIQRECHVTLSLATVSRLLYRLQLLPPPAQRDHESRRRAGVRQVLPASAADGTFQRWKVYFVSESVNRLGDSGPTVTLIAAATGNGPCRFAASPPKRGADLFIDFCRRLLRDVPGRVLLVVRPQGIHQSSAVARFVEQTEGRLQLSPHG